METAGIKQGSNPCNLVRDIRVQDVKRNSYGDRLSSHTITKIVNYAKSKVGKSYGFVASKYYSFQYYCSQLVWQAVYRGTNNVFDIDDDGGAVVTPEDIVYDNDMKLIKTFWTY